MNKIKALSKPKKHAATAFSKVKLGGILVEAKTYLECPVVIRHHA